MFDKSKNDSCIERVLYNGRPNFFFACKNIFLLFLLLGVFSYLAPITLSFVAEIQVYLVNFIELPLTSYTSITIFVIFILIIIWMLWIFLNWRVTEYIITDSKLILKEGILIRKSHYMPYKRITDITVSQGIIRRFISIGHVLVVNADASTEDMKFADVHNPELIQDLIFNIMNNDAECYDYDISNNNGKYNTMNDLRRERYYQQENQFNEYRLDDLHFDNSHNGQFRNQDNEHYSNYRPCENHSRYTNPNSTYDELDHSIEEAMSNLNRNNRFNENQEINRNYPSKTAYQNYNEKQYFSKKRGYKENDRMSKKSKNGPSVIDIYSRKFKKHRK